MNLEEFYAQIGGDFADTLQRLCNENMVKKFVKKYQDDPTCADLHNAALQQDWEVAFRDAHRVVGELVAYCIKANAALTDLSLSELKAFHPAFEQDVYDAMSLKACVEGRSIPGGPAPAAVQASIDEARKQLKAASIA